MSGTPVDIWYVCDWAACDLSCAYCVSRVRRHADAAAMHGGWTSAGSLERHRRILAWISRLPFALGLRLQTVGEPLLSDDVLAGAARLSQLPRIRYVELVTNGVALRHRLPVLLERGRPDRISLWITHPAGQVEAGELVQNAVAARDAGLRVVVNALAFPETLTAVEDLGTRCRKEALPFNIDLGLDLGASHEGSSGLPVLQEPFVSRLRVLPGGAEAEQRAGLGAHPRGRPCSAGHDYFFVAQDGDVYPCWASSKSTPETRIGSALDPTFVLSPRPERHAACPVSTPCVCPEDLSHLADYGLPGPRTTSVRWASAPAPGGLATTFALWRRRSRQHDGGDRRFERALAGAASLDRTATLLDRLEPLTPGAFGFECPLGPRPPLADFGVTLHRLAETADRPPADERETSADPVHNASADPAHDAFATLATWRRGGGGPAWRAVGRVLLEFDTGSRPSGALVPSVFLRLEPPDPTDRRLSDVEAVLTDLGCAPLPADAPLLRRRLAEFWAEGDPVHVGAMTGRPGGAVRVVSPDLTPRRAMEVLDGAAARSCRETANVLLMDASRLDPSLTVRVNVDVGTTGDERVGIDIAFPGRRPAAEGPDGSPWARLLDRLVKRDLCTPAKRAAVIRWPGAYRLVADPWDAADPAVLLSQSISHVKVDVASGRPARAKVYLVCSIGR